MPKIEGLLDALQDALGTVALAREGAQGDIVSLTYLQALQVEEALTNSLKVFLGRRPDTGTLET